MAAGAQKLEKQAVARTTIADAVTGRLRDLILSGQIVHGAALRQDALAEEMGTSRIPVREALSRLEAEGLAASYPHRGYVVTTMSRDEVVELYDLRAMLEPELIKAAIPKMTPGDFDEVESVMRSFELAMAQGDMNSWGELNRRFHLVLYQPAGRKRTLEIVRGLLINTDRYTRVLLTENGPALDRAEEEHRALLDLCRKGSVNQAVALTRDHIQRNCDDLLDALSQRGLLD